MSYGHCDLIPLQIVFPFFILFNTKVLLILHTKFQPNRPNCSEENDDFILLVCYFENRWPAGIVDQTFIIPSLKVESDHAAHEI